MSADTHYEGKSTSNNRVPFERKGSKLGVTVLLSEGPPARQPPSLTVHGKHPSLPPPSSVRRIAVTLHSATHVTHPVLPLTPSLQPNPSPLHRPHRPTHTPHLQHSTTDLTPTSAPDQCPRTCPRGAASTTLPTATRTTASGWPAPSTDAARTRARRAGGSTSAGSTKACAMGKGTWCGRTARGATGCGALERC